MSNLSVTAVVAEARATATKASLLRFCWTVVQGTAAVVVQQLLCFETVVVYSIAADGRE